ncbi:MAG: hypothetical protein IJM87_04825 [Ruminococcus sp.]|nr:hypothetical protein [Ruminococcus sp.]
MIKKLIILSAAIMLVGASGCSDSSSSVSMTDSEVYESRLEKFVEEENPYAFLPDGVRMDDTEHVYEVVPDSEGMIDLEKLGFKYAAPAGSTTYVYECDPLENEGRNSNYTCTASAFITNSLFPQSTEHIRLTYFTEVEPEVIPFDDYNERVPDGLEITEGEYLDIIKADFDRHIPYLTAHENNYCYNFIGVSNNDTEELGDDWDAPGLTTEPTVLSFSYATSSAFEPAPSSERTNVTSGSFELNDKCFGVKICYDQTRYGKQMQKHVYWLYSYGQRWLHRIEFSFDKNAVHEFDEQVFLEALELKEPECLEEGSAESMYFGSFDYRQNKE